MPSDLNTHAPAESRRTWLQWLKFARVRIGIVLMLIVAVLAFVVWWPRRTVVAVLLMGGYVHDPQADDRIRSIQSQLPIDAWAFIGPWIQPRTNWLATDAEVQQVSLVSAPAAASQFKLLQRFPRLTRVCFHATQLGPSLDELAGITTLKDVEVYHLTAADRLGELNRLPHVGMIAVYVGCPRTGGGWKGLRDMSRLTTLLIDHPASFEALSEAGQIANLQYLALLHGVRNDDDLQHLSGNRRLKSFEARWASGVGATGLKHLSNVPSLEFLMLHQCTATDDEFQVIERLRNLKHLTICSTNVSRDGMERLKRALPQCQFDVP